MASEKCFLFYAARPGWQRARELIFEGTHCHLDTYCIMNADRVDMVHGDRGYVSSVTAFPGRFLIYADAIKRMCKVNKACPQDRRFYVQADRGVNLAR